MKTLKSTMLILGAGSVMALTVACAKPPNAELGNTKAAITGARDAEAINYAPAEWDEAQNAMTAAEAEIAAQNSKFALVRSYAKAQQLLAAAESSARTAELAAKAGREQAFNEATTALDQAGSDLDVATALLAELEKCPRKPKGFAQDLEFLKGDLQGFADSLPEVVAALDEGQLLDALNLALSLSSEITTFSQELESAKSKIKC